MNLYTIGYTQKSAQQFFEKISNNNIELLIDVRLHNKSQLAGFTKGSDLVYFLGKLCQCGYKHDVDFAPTDDILKSYRDKKLSWLLYEQQYLALIKKRHCEIAFQKAIDEANCSNVCLLCSEPKPDFCHRRLLAEFLSSKLANIQIIHL